MKKYNCSYRVQYKNISIDGSITIVTTSAKQVKSRVARIVYQKMLHELGIAISMDDIKVHQAESDWSYELQKITEKFLREVTDL